MKKNLSFIPILVFSISTASAQADFIWGKQFGTSNWDGINSLFIIQDKGIVVSGCMNNPMCQSFCKMYNNDGLLLWSRNFIAQGGRGTCGKGFCVSRHGYIYHAGSIHINDSGSFLILRNK